MPNSSARRDRRAARRRQEIMAIGKGMFLSRPYVQVSMEAIAEAADLSKATLYKYFASKVEIYSAIMTISPILDEKNNLLGFVGLEDDIIPNPRSDSIDEEARLLYVSMTRAEEKLYLFHSFKRPRNISYGPELSQKERSRFLDVLGRKSELKKPRQS